MAFYGTGLTDKAIAAVEVLEARAVADYARVQEPHDGGRVDAFERVLIILRELRDTDGGLEDE